MAAHFETYTQDESKSLILYRQVSKSPKIKEKFTLFLNSSEKNAKLEAIHAFRHPFESNMCDGDDTYFRVVGSVHGLICISDSLFKYSYLILLWNPLIRKYVKLPMPKVSRHVHGPYLCFLGFGYDCRNGDHKVVRLVYLRTSEGYVKTLPLAELYSLRDRRWKQVSSDCLKDHSICERWWSQCFLNGAIHWVAWEKNVGTNAFDKNWLVIFDCQEEKFRRMKVPEALSKLCTLDLRVSEYGGKLPLLRSVLRGGIIEGTMERCEIWVKGEYNVGSSWSKVLNLELGKSSDLGWVHCLRKNGEVLAHTKGGELVSYDPKTKQVKGLGLRGCWLTWFSGAYASSLILLDKTTSAKTYGEAGKSKKKRFKYRFFPSGEHILEEVEVDRGSEDEEDLSTGDGKIIADKAEKVLLLEQFLKFNLASNPEEVMASAAAYGF